MRRWRQLLIFAVAGAAGAWAAGMGFIVGRQAWPEPGQADAVVVLGTRTLVNGKPNECMEVRVAEAVRLVKAGLAPLLVVSGGADRRDGMVEAHAMAAIATRLGLSEDQIVAEDAASSTIENLVFSTNILEERESGERVIVVTEPFHMPRAMSAATRLGIDAQAAPSERCDARGPRWMLREPVAVLWYWWKFTSDPSFSARP